MQSGGSNSHKEAAGITSSLLPVVIALFLAVLFWGSSFPATKLVLRGFSPISYVFLRFIGATALFGLMMIRRFRRLPGKTHFKLALMALFEPTLYFIFESIGMQYTSASSASILISAVPGVVALLAGFFLKERLNLRQWMGVALSILGVVLLAGFDDNPTYAESAVLGNSLILLAVLSAALYMIVARHLSAELSVTEITFYQVFYGMLFLLPVFLFHLPNVDWTTITSESAFALIFLILGATVIAFLAYNFAISKINVSKAAVFLNGIPVVSVIVSALLLGERLGSYQFIGGVVVIAGVTLTNWRKKRRSAPPQLVK